VLIAAQSGRALAAAARRAGYAPLVADLYGDDDTSALAARTVRLPIGRAALLRALGRLSEGAEPVGLAYGSGFEGRPDLLDAIAERYRLLGNSAETVRRLKDPREFATLCRECAIPHPEVAAVPGSGEWLEKRAGGTGGAHVRPARPGRVRPPRYVQHRAEGEPVSALFLADGRRALVLGFSVQWAAPAPGQPFRWGGAARPAALDPAIAATMEATLRRLAASAGLIGLNTADFLVRADGFDLVEINPRPGASLDVFEGANSGDDTPHTPVMAGLGPAIHDFAARTKVLDARNKSGHDDLGETSRGMLFHLHVEACLGRLPSEPPRFPGAAASAVAYARRAITLPPGFPWPDWAADRQRAGRPVADGGPLCTVLAQAGDAATARALAASRIGIILDMAETA